MVHTLGYSDITTMVREIRENFILLPKLNYRTGHLSQSLQRRTRMDDSIKNKMPSYYITTLNEVDDSYR